MSDYHTPLTKSNLSDHQLIESFKKMVEIRLFDEEGIKLYQHGKAGGFYHSSIGQEAVCVAAAFVFGQESGNFVQSYRVHGIYLALNGSLQAGFAELMGRKGGCAGGKGGSMHMIRPNLPLGEGLVCGHSAFSVGMAFANKYLGKKAPHVVCFLGDGAMAQGLIYEALNLGKLSKAPVIFVIENNRYGMGTAVNRAIAFEPIGKKIAELYDLPSFYLPGHDLLQLIDGFTDVLNEVNRTSMPVVVEVDTYRYKGHSVSDPGKYRDQKEIEDYIKTKDCIELVRHEMSKRKIESDPHEKEVRENMHKALDLAMNEPEPDEFDLRRGVFADEI